MKTLEERMRAELKAARDISAKYPNTDIPEPDLTRVNEHLTTYKALKVEFEKGVASEDIKARLQSVGFDLGLGDGAPVSRAKSEPYSRTKTWSQNAVKALQAMNSAFAAAGAPGNVKAMISGTISVPNLLDGPVEIDGGPRTLLDLVGRGEPAGERVGNEFGYIRQQTRTNNAAAVPDFGTKPESAFDFAEVKDHYRVFANKTEPLPYRYLHDYARLIEVINKQLAENNLLAIEASLLNGTGPDQAAGTDDFVGILQTSGIQTQAYTTDVLRTLSNAKYKFINAAQPFDGVVMNPTDLQDLELMREGGTTGAFLFGSRQELVDFLGAPVVTSAGMTAGTALYGNFREDSELIPLGDDELVIDAGKRTTDNTFLAMAEGRYGFRVKKPSSFVEVDLTAA